MFLPIFYIDCFFRVLFTDNLRSLCILWFYAVTTQQKFRIMPAWFSENRLLSDAWNDASIIFLFESWCVSGSFWQFLAVSGKIIAWSFLETAKWLCPASSQVQFFRESFFGTCRESFHEHVGFNFSARWAMASMSQGVVASMTLRWFWIFAV